MRLNPKLCFVVEEEHVENKIPHVAGYAVAATDIRSHSALAEDTSNELEPWAREVLKCVLVGAKPNHPSLVTTAIHPSVVDQSVSKRLIVCLLAALRANGT